MYNTCEVDIAGQPGIGKTLCVKELLGKVKDEFGDSVMTIYTNALCLKRPVEIFRSIYFEVFGTGGSIDPYTAMYRLSKLFLN